MSHTFASSASLARMPISGYSTKVCIMYALTLADMMINATADHNDNPGADTWYPLVFIGVQFLIQILNFLMVFMLFFGTYTFQVGLLGVLAKRFRGLLIASGVYFVLYIGYAGAKLGLLLGSGVSQDALWDYPLFVFFSIAQKIVAVVYYLVLLRGTLRLGEARWYQRGPWVNRYTGPGGKPAAPAD